MSLEDDIRQLVKADGRKQSEIAEAAGIHAVNLSQFMNDDRGLPLKTLKRLAEAVGATITLEASKKKIAKKAK